MTAFVSETLAAHDRSDFSSGQPRIDAYFRSAVSQDVKRRYAACYVLVETQSQHVAGFYTLSAQSVDLSALPTELRTRLPRYPTVPAVLIGWLGRDLRFRGRGLGALLLADALHRIVTSSVGAHAIVADPLDAEATAFYVTYGFITLESGRLFVPVATAAQMFAKP